jgi:hypothetical protein
MTLAQPAAAALMVDLQNGLSIINDNGLGDSDPTVG